MGNRSSGIIEGSSNHNAYVRVLRRQQEHNEIRRRAAAGNAAIAEDETPSAPEVKKKRRDKIKCPACKSLLIPPPHPIDVFACPCGQTLALPSCMPPHPGLRCPRCQTPNQRLPEGAVLMPCVSCGLELRREDDNQSSYLAADVEDQPTKSTNVWRRRKITAEQFGWRRQWTEQELFDIVHDEQLVLSSMQQKPNLEQNTQIVVDEATRNRLGDGCIGPEALAGKHSEMQLRKILDDRLLDHCHLSTKLELASRVFAFEVAGVGHEQIERTRNSGFVRAFRPPVEGSNNNCTYLDCMDACDSHISTRLGVETTHEPSRLTTDECLQVASFPLKEKLIWFQEQVKKLRVPWEQGHVRVRVRRDNVLEDSFNAFLKLSSDDMHRFFRFEFIDEPGQDAGGVTREWFTLIVERLFDLDCGMFEYGQTGNVSYQISADSTELLRHFRFFGRVLGKALFDGQHIAAHLTRVLYKHFLAWPIVEDDIEFVDEEIAKSTREIRQTKDVTDLCLDFTMTFTNGFGENAQTIELKPQGAECEVTNENREEYLALRLKQISLLRIAPQLHELLIGLYETIPLALLSVFDFSELELLVCGLPEIDMSDWKAHTVYRGAFESRGVAHPVVAMFWEALEESSPEDRARFLQFATGTSRVPVRGFAGLHGSDGNIKLFTIESVTLEQSIFPRAHTCFNRVDLPLYNTKEDMLFRISQAMNMEGTGFQLE